MTIHCYINRQSRQLQIWIILRVLEVIDITCNMGARDLPDMYILRLWAYISEKSLIPMLRLLQKSLFKETATAPVEH